MKKLLILGALALCLVQLLTSCCVDDYDGPTNYAVDVPSTIHKSFNPKETKANPIYFTWENGMKVLVVSLDKNGVVMYKDECVVSNASGGGSTASWASIEADVAEEASHYLLCYPATAVNAVVDEVLQENYTPANETGKLKDVAILSSGKIKAQPYADMIVTFYPKNSILYVGNTLDINGGSGTSVVLYDLYFTMYTKEYPSGKAITVPKSYKYSDDNPYYIHVSTQDLGTGTAKNGVAVYLRGYCGDSTKYYFWQCENWYDSALKDKGKGMTINSLPAGKYKKILPSKYIHND